MPMKQDKIEELLQQPNIAVVAVTAPDGHPHAVPTWYEYRNGEVVFQTERSAFNHKCLLHDNRITSCVDTKTPPYKAVVLKGRAGMTEMVDDERLERMAIAYLGEKAGRAYAKTGQGHRVIVVSFKPTRVSAGMGRSRIH